MGKNCDITGADVRNVKREDAGKVLSETLRQFMYDLKVDNGLNAVGYTKDDIPELVRGTLPQVGKFDLDFLFIDLFIM